MSDPKTTPADDTQDIAQQCEEIEALSAIYGDDFVIVDEASRIYEIRVSNESDTWWSGTLQVLLPPQYPSKSAPVFEVHSAWMSDSEMFDITDQLHSIHRENKGEILLYLWVEKLREFIDNKVAEFESEQLEKVDKEKGFTFEDADKPEFADQNHSNVISHSVDEMVVTQTSTAHTNSSVHFCPEILHGEPFTDRKSTFQAHLAHVSKVSEIEIVLGNLKQNRKIGNACHNIMAYRIFCQERNVFLQDCDDNGELHAGSRLLHLLQILEVKDVVVVVTRWYGGILLGPDRFKHYNNSARELLKSAGFIPVVDKESNDPTRGVKSKSYKLLAKMKKHRY